MDETRHQYETLRMFVLDLPRSPEGSRRNVQWYLPGKLGFAKDHLGRIEIYIPGPKIRPTSEAIGPSDLKFNIWYEDPGNQSFEANRLVLPAAPHLHQATAFIATELIREGVELSPQMAFSRAEPLIEVWLERLKIPDSVIVGLIGELLVLNALASKIESRFYENLVDNWFGHGRSNRDFQLGGVGLEVKTTTASSSTHRFENLKQLEPGYPEVGEREDFLYIASIGLEEINEDHDPTGAWTLPLVVEQIREKFSSLPQPESGRIFQKLLRLITKYGSVDGIGYDHETMADDEEFCRKYTIAFARYYDMSDPLIEVLHFDDLTEYRDVVADSMSFSVRLRERVNGDINPVPGLSAGAEKLVSKARWA